MKWFTPSVKLKAYNNTLKCISQLFFCLVHSLVSCGISSIYCVSVSVCLTMFPSQPTIACEHFIGFTIHHHPPHQHNLLFSFSLSLHFQLRKQFPTCSSTLNALSAHVQCTTQPNEPKHDQNGNAMKKPNERTKEIFSAFVVPCIGPTGSCTSAIFDRWYSLLFECSAFRLKFVLHLKHRVKSPFVRHLSPFVNYWLLLSVSFVLALINDFPLCFFFFNFIFVSSSLRTKIRTNKFQNVYFRNSD